MDVNDARLVRLMSKRIGTCLTGKPGQVRLWRLA
jgi:hypothetical protein